MECRYCEGECSVGYGMCHCGCGGRTNTKKSPVALRGVPQKMLRGHYPDPLRLVRIDKKTGCHVFQGYTNQDGYGRVSVKGRLYMAHRLSYEREKGPIPEGLYIRHACDNPACINPDHLSPGTQKQNMSEASWRCRWNRQFTPEKNAEILELKYAGEMTHKEIAKRVGCHPSHVGRLAREARGFNLPPGIGENNPMSSLRPEIVLAIRRDYKTGEWTYSDLARRYGVHIGNVGKIVRRERWAHLPEEN